MGFKEVQSLDVSTTVAIGGVDKKTGKKNPSQIEGYYLGAREVPDKFNKDKMGKLHVFKTEAGNVGVFGKSDSNRKLGAVTPGTMVRMSYTGKVPTTKGNDMLQFKIEVDSENTLEGFSGLNAQDTSAEANYETADDDLDEDNTEVEYDSSANNKVAMSATERTAAVNALLNRNKKK